MIQKILTQIYEYVTYFISPPSCLYCHADLSVRTAFCHSCMIQILPIVPFDFYIGKHTVMKVFAVSSYKDPLRSLILAKHHSNETAIHFLAHFMATSPVVQQLDFDVITFIPLHWTRYASRGFNQAQMIAQALAYTSGRPVIPFIKRCKKTQFQARLTLQQREHNVQNAFALDAQYSHQIVGKKILIVDDLFTTGSTMKAVCSLLLPCQPQKIEIFVGCRVINS